MVERHTDSLTTTKEELKTLKEDFNDLQTKHVKLNKKLSDTEMTAANEKAELEKTLKNLEEEV